MKKKIVFISIIIAMITISAVYLLSTYADPEVLNDSFPITLTGNTSVTVPAMSMKKVIYQIKNNNTGTVSYGIGYSSQSNNVAVKTYYNSADAASGTIGSNSYKNVTLAAINNSSSSATINLSTILGYENGGNLIIPSGTAQVTETVYNAASYITNLYTNAGKSTATVNSITYNLAPTVNLMNDRLASMSTDINGGNIRYYGANPDNYVWLGDTYTSTYTFVSKGLNVTRNVGDKKLWRIVGVFDDKLKLVSNDPINTQGLSWDTSDSELNGGHGINQWGPSGSYEGADLMRLLNPEYESTSVNNSLYWTKGDNGTVYIGSNNNTSAGNSFVNTGLSDSEKNMIDVSTWYLGTYNSSASYVDVQYVAERGNAEKICTQGDSTCDDTVIRTNTWNGKVGLINASDYGYATDISQCNNVLNNYNDSSNSYACRSNDWLFDISNNQWTISSRARSSSAYLVFRVSSDGDLPAGSSSDGYKVRPTFYLKSSVIIDANGVSGSEQNPFQLLLN